MDSTEPLSGATARFKNPAYRALIERIADEAPCSGWPEDVDLLKEILPLADQELAIACDLHKQAVTDELSIDPSLLSRYLRGETDLTALLGYLRSATEHAVCEAVRSDVMAELQCRAELAQEHQNERYYGGGACFSLHEQLARDYAVSRLLK